MKLFSKASIKLTFWYLAVLMAVSIAFSATIYQVSSYELNRPFPLDKQPILQYIYGPTDINHASEERASEGQHHLLSNLVILNLVTLVLGSAGSYLFARRTLQPIEDAMKSQARFTSDASHELHTPLAVIQAENEVVLRAKKPSTKVLRDTLRSNIEEVSRLQRLTNRLLTLSNNHDLDISTVSLEEACIDAVNRQITPAQSKKISIDNKVAAILVRSNRDAIADIVSILLENAIKYSPENSAIRLIAEHRGHIVQLSVIDQGPGIRNEDAQHIFDRFYRADHSRSKSHVDGHGLGLALALRLAHRSNSHLTLERSSPSGSTFMLKLQQA